MNTLRKISTRSKTYSLLYTKNNRLTIGYGRHIKREPLTWRAESQLAAIDIASNYDNLYISLSGGCDSEYVCKVFKESGLKFTPIFLNYEDADNSIERWWAERWCLENNMELEVYNFSLWDNVELIQKHIDAYQIRMPLNVPLLLMADYVRSKGGQLLHGAGNYELFNDDMFRQSESDFYLDLIHQDYSPHPGSFYIWSPELIYSWLRIYNPSLNADENKWRFYGTSKRPKLMGHEQARLFWKPIMEYAKKYGPIVDIDVGTKEKVYEKIFPDYNSAYRAISPN